MTTTATTTPAATAVEFTPPLPPPPDLESALLDDSACAVTTTVLPGDICVTIDGDALVTVAVFVLEGVESGDEALPTLSFMPLKYTE